MKTIQAQAEHFAAWVKEKMADREIRFVADLKRMSGLSQSTLGGILEPKTSPNTGKFSLPRRDSVIALARALGADRDEALRAAGYLPASETAQSDEQFFVFAMKRGAASPITQITDPELLAAIKKAITDKLTTE